MLILEDTSNYWKVEELVEYRKTVSDREAEERVQLFFEKFDASPTVPQKN